jgi:chemotaxis-related protein WspB
MFVIYFSVGAQRYAVDGRTVVAVLPRVDLTALPHVPPEVAGVFNFRSRVVPVIDLCRLLGGYPCGFNFDARLLLVNYQTEGEKPHLLGLLAENITETDHLKPEELVSSGVAIDEAPYLGDVIPQAESIVQTVRIEQLLPDDLKARLFREPA